MPKSRKFKKLEQKFLTGYGRIRTEFVKYDPISLASYLHKYINNDLEFPLPVLPPLIVYGFD